MIRALLLLMVSGPVSAQLGGADAGQLDAGQLDGGTPIDGGRPTVVDAGDVAQLGLKATVDPSAIAPVPLASATAQGFVALANIYGVPTIDGGRAFVAIMRQADGGTRAVWVDSSPCAKRPTGIPAGQCLSRLTDGGTREQGDENVMQANGWVGVGCRPVACAIFAGDSAP